MYTMEAGTSQISISGRPKSTVDRKTATEIWSAVTACGFGGGGGGGDDGYSTRAKRVQPRTGSRAQYASEKRVWGRFVGSAHARDLADQFVFGLFSAVHATAVGARATNGQILVRWGETDRRRQAFLGYDGRRE